MRVPDVTGSPSIMGLCALHGLHNRGSDKEEAKKLVTQWARAPTQQLAEKFLNQLKACTSETVVRKLIEREAEISFRAYMKMGQTRHTRTQTRHTCADFISDDLPLEYRQIHMPYLRQKVGCDMLRGKLSYPLISKLPTS